MSLRFLVFRHKARPLWVWMVGLMGIVLLIGCAESQVKDTETEQQVRRIEAFLSGLEAAYAREDVGALKSFFSPEFQEKHPRFFDALQETFSEAEGPKLELFLDVVHWDGETFKVLLHWESGTQATPSFARQRGNATFLLTSKEPLQIKSLGGDHPFPQDLEPAPSALSLG